MKCRLSQFCSINNICSSLEAKKLINLGLIKVNNSVVKSDVLIPEGLKVDNIKLLKSNTLIDSNKISILLHKPFGYLSTYCKNSLKWSKNLLIRENRSEEDTQTNLEPYKLNLTPLNPLEVNSSGLLIYSQDKSLVKKFSDCEEEFHVIFKDVLTEYKLLHLKGEVFLDGCSVGPLVVKDYSERSANICFKGSSLKLKRICLLAGLEIRSLKRTRLSNIKLGSLSPGEWRVIRPYEFT